MVSSSRRILTPEEREAILAAVLTGDVMGAARKHKMPLPDTSHRRRMFKAEGDEQQTASRRSPPHHAAPKRCPWAHHLPLVRL